MNLPIKFFDTLSLMLFKKLGKAFTIPLLFVLSLSSGCIGFRPPDQGKNIQVGEASWYGRDFHGRPTASGEIYDMHKLTAAHKTVRLGTYATVKNLKNGKKVTVKINDRGPFVKGRIIDLSYGAARKIDMDVAGTARVEVRFQGTFSAPVKEKLDYYLQVGSFIEEANAENLKSELRKNYANVVIREVSAKGRNFNRVCVGPLKEDTEISRTRDELLSLGYVPVALLGDCAGQ